MLSRLKIVISQNLHECNNKISIFTDRDDKDLTELAAIYKAQNLKKLEDFSNITNCLLILKCQNINSLFKFINEQIEKAKIILIVKKDFDFNNLVKQVNAYSIDAIILKDEKEYIIVISKY